MSWQDLLYNASAEQTLQRAQGNLGKGVEYVLGSGGIDPTQPIGTRCDCSGFVAWAIGIPRELPPGSGKWMNTDAYWNGGRPGADGLVNRVPDGQAQAGDFYVYPYNGTHPGHIAIITEAGDSPANSKIIHCSLGNWERFSDAIQITDAGLFGVHPNVRIMRVDYDGLKALFGVAPRNAGPRLIIAVWTGESGTDPFRYVYVSAANLQKDQFVIAPHDLAPVFGKTDDRTDPLPVRQILTGWGLNFTPNLDHENDTGDPRVYLFVTPNSPDAGG
jgi:hypothetical protein